MVPNGWEIKKLNDVFKVIDSLHQTPTFSDTGLPMVRVTDVKGGILNLTNTVRVSEEVFAEYTKKYAPKKHDIVFSRVGSYGISSYADSDEPFCLGQNTVIAESNENAISKYIFNVLKSTYIKRQIERTVDGSSHKTVSLKVIRALDIPIPPLPEQRKIAKILSTWDKAISTTEKLIETSKQQKKALMQQLLTGKKRLLNPETGKAFEGEWKEVKLKSCVQFLNGQRKPIKQEERANIQGGYPYYGATGIIDYVNDYIFDDEIILLGEDGENILSRVLPHVFVVRGKVWVNNHAHVLKANNGTDTDFLCMYLESLDYRKYNSGSAQPKINKAVCEKIPVRLPTMIEQQKIASTLTVADKEIEVLKAKLDHFKQEKKALMQQLLTGKRRVKVAEAESA